MTLKKLLKVVSKGNVCNVLFLVLCLPLRTGVMPCIVCQFIQARIVDLISAD